MLRFLRKTTNLVLGGLISSRVSQEDITGSTIHMKVIVVPFVRLIVLISLPTSCGCDGPNLFTIFHSIQHYRKGVSAHGELGCETRWVLHVDAAWHVCLVNGIVRHDVKTHSTDVSWMGLQKEFTSGFTEGEELCHV